ncbi:DUF4226 domain-containing protein [Mycobacterium sp.]|uniref:DUF4226 domain-containing protein n=1 Tax=Mycobacterium sp. TaxID=1785 RepID=UPI0031CF302F
MLGLFGNDDDDDEYSQGLQSFPAPHVVTGYIGPPAPPPPPPGGSSGMQGGADRTGTDYQQTSGAVSATDDKVNSLLKEIFASNDRARSQVSGIVDGIKAAQQQVVTDPAKAHDPQSLAYFNQYLDQQLGKVEQILDGAKVDSKKQAELLSALGDEYRKTTPGQDASKDHSGAQGGADQSGGGGGGGGDQSGGGGGGGGDQSGGGVVDPFAGLGGLGGGLGGADPLSSMLGPATSALSFLPGALGGAGASLPAGALGALGDQLGGRDGASDGFSDHHDHDHDHANSDFTDSGSGSGSGQNQGGGDPNAVGSTQNQHPAVGADQGQPQPGQQPATPAAVPASAPGDPNLVVRMPDGSPVTATTAQHKGALDAVVGGASVTDAWKKQGVELPPPGTPVTTPGDPSHLVPGEVAQYRSRDPVMYAGNGKIWLDGQLQPQSTLPTGDFLGWLDPGAVAGVPAAPASAPAAAGSPVLTATTG